MPEFYVRVVVHGTIPAENAGEALSLLCERIHEGIGPDPEGDEGREWGIAISAAVVGNDVYANQEFLEMLAGLK